MLFFAFFSAVFSSVSWLIYAIMFVRSRLDGAALFEQEPQIMLALICVVVLPVLAKVLRKVFAPVRSGFIRD